MIGVGVGPGDPELLTLKAARILGEADVVAHFSKHDRRSNARVVAAAYLRPDTVELPLVYPVTTEIDKDDPVYRQAISGFFDESAKAVEKYLIAGYTVAVLSAGDPLFYGSYMHLHLRLAGRYPTKVIAGVTGMSGCWSTLGVPIAQGDDVFVVVPGTLSEVELARRFGGTDACIVMKVGRNLAKVRRALRMADRLEDAILVEHGTTEGMIAVRLHEKADNEAAYFSLVLLPGWRTKL